ADPVGVLTGGGLGGLLLIVGTALVVAGLCWSDRIVERVSAR
ncbi:MAG TPA: type II secretion system protein F, partial [Gordonia sp. (in: high G+C Gram-positive bacteria)]|nr:type II secretion system protein F [Gordonia sp. (in: high G+C Gram-positive bacteria)]